MSRAEELPPVITDDVADLVASAQELLGDSPRRLLGLTGAPGSGKSTVAGRLAHALGEVAVVVPMDGFHLTDEELVRLGVRDRKGAPETFDVRGYLSSLDRIRREDGTVYAPAFDRHREMSLAGAIAVRPEHRLVITEGNYLLLDLPDWGGVRRLLDQVWFVESDDRARVERLVRRHVEHGKDHAAAVEWVNRSDEANARLVAGTRSRADLVVTRR